MSANLTNTVLTLNKEFDKAQDHLHSIAHLCGQAEERIRKSQALQNDFARQFHRLSEQTRQVISVAESHHTDANQQLAQIRQTSPIKN